MPRPGAGLDSPVTANRCAGPSRLVARMWRWPAVAALICSILCATASPLPAVTGGDGRIKGSVTNPARREVVAARIVARILLDHREILFLS